MWIITYETINLVSRYRGTLPVILSCPHDGEDKPSRVLGVEFGEFGVEFGVRVKTA
jgi:N-formylglutamate amidohydrolase